MNHKSAISAVLLSVFGTAIVTTLVFPNRPVGFSIQAFFTALTNAIRATLGTKDTSSKGSVGKNLPAVILDHFQD